MLSSGSAPRSRRISRLTSTFSEATSPWLQATWAAVLPWRSLRVGSAFALSNISMVCGCLVMAAKCKGVCIEQKKFVTWSSLEYQPLVTNYHYLQLYKIHPQCSPFPTNWPINCPAPSVKDKRLVAKNTIPTFMTFSQCQSAAFMTHSAVPFLQISPPFWKWRNITGPWASQMNSKQMH